MKKTLISACACLLALSLAAASRAPEEKGGKFEAGKNTFLLNGEPYLVKAAELHYPRIPRPYWDNRIKMCKALGMNTVCLYVFWNAHEPEPDRFDFTGQNDLREFVKLCQANGMNVILRPGPYVCAEWEMGGLPWWLLKNKDVRLREDDPYFLERVERFQKAVADQVADLTVNNGGPIIMVQVENEYGSYGINKPYVAAIRDMLRNSFGNDVTLFQCDWASNFTNNGLDDLIWTMNFGTGADIDQQFARLKELRPEAPLMCSEYWSGWFDKWGAGHETRSADQMIAGLDKMLSKGISFSLYMTHGGTNWGHWAGANSPGYAPDVTSYDYDAPISESGQPTPKYHALRRMFARYDKKQTKIPETVKPIKIPEFQLTEAAPLFSNLPAPHADHDIKNMEQYDQGFGSILYRTTLPELASSSLLTINDPHDYAQIFLDGKLIGALDRRNNEKSITLPPCPSGATLDILVEAMGRINFGRAIKDFKGITDNVELTLDLEGRPFTCDLKEWEVFNLEDKPEYYGSYRFIPTESLSQDADGRLPRGVYRGEFTVKKPSDTFLDMSDWGKGLVYVNGHPMGRFWEIGPQQSLYMPGCWLREGKNEILVFDILGPRRARVAGLDRHVIDNLRLPEPRLHRSGNDTIDLTAQTPVISADIDKGNGWKKITASTPATGRYVCLEFPAPHDGNDNISIAEIYLCDTAGKNLPREKWNVIYADSEETEGNHTADKLFDLQESTYWSTGNKVHPPHHIVIDLGAPQEIGALRLLPRMETGTPGAPASIRMYVGDKPQVRHRTAL